MTEFANQVAINELEATIKKQNQILLHIKAELEAAKQYNPFDLVLMAGSMENISNVINGQTEPFIDEGCVGCCKVVDVAAGLQEELDECNERCTKLGSHNMQITANLLYRKAIIEELKTDNSSLRDTIDQMAKKWSRDRATIKNFKTIETRETDRLHKTILDMDVTISDLMDNDRRINGFLDEYRVTVDNRDKTIEDYKETIRIERMDRVTEKESINRKFCEDLRKKNAIIKELKDRNAEDLDELYALDKKEIDRLKHVISARESSIDECEKIGRHNVSVLKEIINGLEAELSARKEDSEVLKKVVEIVKKWEDDMHCNRTVMKQIATIVKDCLDAPEGPPETPIDEKACVFCGCKNPSIQVGRDWFCSMRCADGQADVNKHIHDTDETQDITVTFAFLELP